MSATTITPPEQVADNPTALAFWKRNIAHCEPSDSDTFAVLCLIFSDLLTTREMMHDDKEAAKRYSSLLSRYLGYSKLFALNPLDRRLSGQKNQQKKSETYNIFPDDEDD